MSNQTARLRRGRDDCGSHPAARERWHFRVVEPPGGLRGVQLREARSLGGDDVGIHLELCYIGGEWLIAPPPAWVIDGYGYSSLNPLPYDWRIDGI